jgi:glycosyltransferase involved in cell wall biosynthesis
MAACNQGEWLAHTISSAIEGLQGAKDWEIIVIDDHSNDNCVDLAKEKHDKNERVSFHKPEQKVGVSHARYMAGEMTTGEIIITTDTHCSYPPRSLHRLSHWAKRLRAIIMPAVSFQRPNEEWMTVQGGGLAISPRGLRVDRPRRPRDFPCMFGSIYLMSREVWDALGGWPRLPGYWAGEEQMMSLLAYRLGIPIKLVSKHVCKHHKYRERGKYPFELPPAHISDIGHYIHATCLPETYEEIWGPLITLYYNRPLSKDIEIEPMREWINLRSVWDEHRVFKTVLGLDDVREHPAIKARMPELKKIRDAG